MLSSEYGWTSNYIWTLTSKEVAWRMKTILDRRNLEMKFNASLHGHEISTPRHSTANKKAPKEKLSKKQLKAIESAQEDAQKRIKARYGR